MSNNNKYLFLSIILALISCFIAVMLRMFTHAELWFHIFTATIGVIITAIITQVLLRGQTENDAKKEKDTKVFEEKLKIYQDFLHCLHDAIKGGEVTKEEAVALEFQTSYITMHTESEHIKVIARQVKNIIESLDESDKSAEQESRNNDTLMQSLFSIVNEFKKELYLTTPTLEDKQNIKEAIKSFSAIVEAVEVNQKDIADNTEGMESIEQNLTDFAEEMLKLADIDTNIWSTETKVGKNGIYINVAKKGDEENVRIILNHDANGEHFFQIHLGNVDSAHEVYKHLKWRFGGRQNKWCWWKWLENSMKTLASAEHIKNRDWGFPATSISKQLTALIAYVDTFERIRNEIYEPAPKEMADVWPYYEAYIAFDYDKTLKDNRLFMDVELIAQGSYTIRLGNRDNDTHQLLTTLNAIGFKVTESDLQGKRYTAYNGIDAKEAISKIQDIDSQIARYIHQTSY